MRKITLCCLIPFSYLHELNVSPYKATFNNLTKNFGNIFLINTEYLTNNKIKLKKYKNIGKNFKLKNPKNYKDLNNFIPGKKVIIINSIPRTLEFFILLLYLTIKKIPKIEISNLGNIQKGTEDFMGKFNSKFLKTAFLKSLPRKIIHLFAALGLISKVDCRFTSHKNIYERFHSYGVIRKSLIYYKNTKHVKSNLYELKENKKLTEKYIVLIDAFPLYAQVTSYKSINLKEIEEHYIKLNSLLNYLKKIYKKDIAVCIHPAYSQKFYSKYLSEHKVYKYRTVEFIKKSNIILTYRSSAIVNAIKYNKKIISIESEIFKWKEYSSYIYEKALNTKTLRLKNRYNFNPKKLLLELEKKVRNYKKYKVNHLGIELKNSASKDVSNYIVSNYDSKYLKNEKFNINI